MCCTAGLLSLASDACAAGTVRLFILDFVSSRWKLTVDRDLVNRDDFISKYRMTNYTKEQIAASTVTG